MSNTKDDNAAGVGSGDLLGWFLFREKTPRKWKAIHVLNTADPTEKPREVLWNGTVGSLPYAWKPIDFQS